MITNEINNWDALTSQIEKSRSIVLSTHINADGDGVEAGEDCDDNNANAFPGAEETCDGVDNDCDGETDEDDATDAATWYIDYDDDGYGSDSFTMVACEQPDGRLVQVRSVPIFGPTRRARLQWLEMRVSKKDCKSKKDGRCKRGQTRHGRGK